MATNKYIYVYYKFFLLSPPSLRLFLFFNTSLSYNMNIFWQIIDFIVKTVVSCNVEKKWVLMVRDSLSYGCRVVVFFWHFGYINFEHESSLYSILPSSNWLRLCDFLMLWLIYFTNTAGLLNHFSFFIP